MNWFGLFGNACTACVLPLCFFTQPEWHTRWLDMLIIGLNIFAVLNKLDSIEDKLNP